ncbi:MAG: hypothetical protein AABY22_30550 [Nanoarchaeota archaeon]
MPQYSFQHPQTDEIKTIIMSMREEHKYKDENGVKWERVWDIPQARIDGKLQCWNSAKFVEKTGRMKGTIGDLQDYSKELSQQRAKESPDGKDPLAKKAREKWEAERPGKKWKEKPDKDLIIEV